ncbi:MAG: hypothetical protein QME61_02865, partial [Patescibacteria group bacterium]|nr:hypothetical protein [Patescibacteria group bacterium]
NNRLTCATDQTGGGVNYWELTGSDLAPKDSSWDVAIGKSTADSGYKLDVSGQIKASKFVDAEANLRWIDPSSNESAKLEGAILLHEMADPPTAGTTRYGKIYVKSEDSKLWFMDDSGNEFDLTARANWGRDADNGYLYPHVLTDKVGIGTNTGLSRKLTVQADGDGLIKLYHTGTSRYYAIDLGGPSPSGDEAFTIKDIDAATDSLNGVRFKITKEGNVEIPSGNLTVGGLKGGGMVVADSNGTLFTSTMPGLQDLDSVLEQGSATNRTFSVDENGDETTYIGGNLKVGYDLDVGNKLTVKTIDPRYKIDGKTYATYVSDFAGGVRVETSGIAKVSQNQKSNIKDQKCEYVIDFDDLEEGSNLWLFWQVSNKNLDDLVVILTPSFDGKVWYEKEGNRLVIFGDKEGEVSFRLTAPRKDWQEHPSLLEVKE